MTPTLLIPGLLTTSDVFAPQIPFLWQYGPVTVASLAGGDTIGAMSTSILASAPPRFALAGISMGGYVCLEIMRQAPGRVLRLALLDTSARPDTPEQSERRRASVQQAEHMDFAKFAEGLFTNASYEGNREDPQLQMLNRTMARSVRIEDYKRNTQAAITRPDARPTLSQITVPTMVLVGDHDQVTPPDHAREMAFGIPGALLEVVQRCGHASTIEQPEVVNKVLGNWLREY